MHRHSCWSSLRSPPQQRLLCQQTRPPAALQPPAEAVSQMVVALLGVARKSVERRAQIAQQEAEGAGEEEIESARESEDDLMTNIVDAIGYSLKTLRAGFLPIFDKLVEFLLFEPALSACQLFDQFTIHLAELSNTLEQVGSHALEVIVSFLSLSIIQETLLQ